MKLLNIDSNKQYKWKHSLRLRQITQ